MRQSLATEFVTQELEEINEIIEKRASDLRYNEKVFDHKVQEFEKLKIQFISELRKHSNKLFHQIFVRTQRATEDQALKVQSVLEKAELIAHICAQQKKELESLQVSFKTQSDSLELHKKRLQSEQRRNRQLHQKVFDLEKERQRFKAEKEILELKQKEIVEKNNLAQLEKDREKVEKTMLSEHNIKSVANIKNDIESQSQVKLAEHCVNCHFGKNLNSRESSLLPKVNLINDSLSKLQYDIMNLKKEEIGMKNKNELGMQKANNQESSIYPLCHYESHRCCSFHNQQSIHNLSDQFIQEEETRNNKLDSHSVQNLSDSISQSIKDSRSLSKNSSRFFSLEDINPNSLRLPSQSVHPCHADGQTKSSNNFYISQTSNNHNIEVENSNKMLTPLNQFDSIDSSSHFFALHSKNRSAISSPFSKTINNFSTLNHIPVLSSSSSARSVPFKNIKLRSRSTELRSLPVNLPMISSDKQVIESANLLKELTRRIERKKSQYAVSLLNSCKVHHGRTVLAT